jgi:hypothetical protein
MTFQDLPLENSNFFVLADVPLADAVVVASRKDDLVTFSERDSPYGSVVTTERFQKLAAFGVPEADSVVLAAADDSRTVLRERNGSNRSFVTVKTAELWWWDNFAGFNAAEVVRSYITRTPDQNAFVIPSRYNGSAIRREGCRVDRPMVTIKR